MKKITILLFLLIATFANAQVNLGKLKDKAKDKLDDKKENVSSAADPAQGFSEKGEKAFSEKKYEEAKGFFEKAEKATASEYGKSQVKNRIYECDKNISTCDKRITTINNYYSEKNYTELVHYYDIVSNFEEICLCDEKMKSVIDDSRKQMVAQKEEYESKALADMEKSLAEMENMKYTCSNMAPDNGITGPTHTKNLKKIVFSKSEIIEGKENEANFTHNFTLNDDIYSRAYLEKSLKNEAMSIGDCYGTISFIRWTFNDGSVVMPDWMNVNKIPMFTTGAKETTFQQPLSPNASKVGEDNNYELKKFLKIIRELPAGTYKIKMEAVYDIPKDEEATSARRIENCRLYTTKFGAEKVLATGEFNLTVTEEGKKAFYKKMCNVYEKDIDNYNQPEYNVVSNASSLVKASKSVDWNKFTLLKIVGNNWVYNKNYYGIILSRESSAGAFLLNKETGFVHYSRLSFFQENTSSGGSSYSPVSVSVEAQDDLFVKGYDGFYKSCIGK